MGYLLFGPESGGWQDVWVSTADQSEPRSELIKVDPRDPNQSVMARAGRILRSGGLVAFPTETVYGLGANALDRSAILAVFSAKGRPATDPLIVHISSADQAEALTTRWAPSAAALAKEFWPGPLTLVLPRSSVVSDEISAGRPTVALRVPDHPVAQALIQAAGVPVAAPSANRFGRISPTTAAHVAAELDGSYELLLDAGPTMIGVESSVVDLSGDHPALLRPGGVTLEELQRIVPEIDHAERRSSAEEVAAEAPGQFLRHYSPRTPLVLVDSGARASSGLASQLSRNVLVAELRSSLVDKGVNVSVVDLPEESEVAARELYARLRIADASGAALILASVQNNTGMGRAVNDRLFRAAHGRVASDCTQETVTGLVGLTGDSS